MADPTEMAESKFAPSVLGNLMNRPRMGPFELRNAAMFIMQDVYGNGAGRGTEEDTNLLVRYVGQI